MKILLVSPITPPVGGIASWSEMLLEKYPSNDYGIELVHQNTAIIKRRITSTSLVKRIYDGVFNTRRIIKNLKQNILIEKPDLIHLTSSGSLALFKDLKIIHIAQRNGVPVVMHFHFGRIPEIFKKCKWECCLLKRVVKSCKQVIVIDRKSLETLNNIGFKNIEIVPNPVSIELEKFAREDILKNEICQNRKIVFVGHSTKSKGIYDLVSACIRNNSVNELYVIGPYENSVKKKLIKMQSNSGSNLKLEFLGSVRKSIVYSYIKNSVALILPSYTEGFPIVVLEAMALGRPVVATSVGAVPEMLGIDSETPCGITVPVKNIEALRDAIGEILDNIDKAMFFGRNGMERVLENYTLSAVCKQYEEVWHKAIKQEINIENNNND